MKKIILRYSITFWVGLIIALVIMLSKSIFSQDNAKNVHHILTDAFFVPGVVICGYGLLVMASNGGTFDMLVYGVKRLFSLFQKDINKVKYKTFYDYRVAKQETKNPFGYLVIVGLIFIGVSMVFLILYYQY